MFHRFCLLAIAAVVGFGCAKHVPAPTYDVVRRQNYAYQRVNEGAFIIAATDATALKAAMAEIGCGTKFLCEIDHDGDLFSVELHTK